MVDVQIYPNRILSTDADPPPPYEINESEAQQLFNRIQGAAVAEQGGALSAEAESLRDFLLYCLAVDYRVSVPLVLSAPEREHYVEMSTVLIAL